MHSSSLKHIHLVVYTTIKGWATISCPLIWCIDQGFLQDVYILALWVYWFFFFYKFFALPPLSHIIVSPNFLLCSISLLGSGKPYFADRSSASPSQVKNSVRKKPQRWGIFSLSVCSVRSSRQPRGASRSSVISQNYPNIPMRVFPIYFGILVLIPIEMMKCIIIWHMISRIKITAIS